MRRLLTSVAVTLLCVAVAACKEEGTITVHKLTFKGVKAVDEARLRAALATQQSAKLPWGKKRFFDRPRFDADLQRIQAFYADRGYPDARVAPPEIKINANQNAVDVVVTITEGEPVKMMAVDFVGFDVIPANHLRRLQGQVPLKVGSPRDRQLVLTSHEMALNELRDHGYPYAKVSTTENDGASGKEASILFTADPGIVAHFGPVQIEGNKSVADNVIRRELGYRPGDLYRRSVVQNTQRRLYGMALFQFVNVTPIDPAQQSAEVGTKVTVAEGKHQRLNFGVGYGTEEKGRVDAEYHHLNFFGSARTAGVHLRYSSLDRGARLDFNQPYFFRPQLSLGGEAQQWYTFTPAYQSVITGGKVSVTHGSGSDTSWSVSIESERNISSIETAVLGDLALRNDLIALGLDPTTGKQEGTLGALGFDLQRSTADSLLNARHGYQVALHAEKAGEILPGTFNYYAISIDSRHYQSVGRRLVIANRLQLGNIDASSANGATVPFSKKYFLGGASTLRGWGRYEVSPLSTSGLPIGGDSLFAFSSEARADVRGNLGAVVFLDAGNVWAGAWGIKLNDLRYAIGPGLRYQTPVGPVRFDLGFQLNPIAGLMINGAPQTRRLRFHFSIGQAF